MSTSTEGQYLYATNELHDHKPDPLRYEGLCVTRYYSGDGQPPVPGPGGAYHEYAIYPSDKGAEPPLLRVRFQAGAVQEAGVNGVSTVSLLAIILDHLRGFQKGPLGTRENACAITHFEEGLMWLHKRTLDRERRGVKGRLQE